MLSRYDKKIITITLSDGSTISGKAEVLPSGYALDTFGIGKECIRIKDMYIFADDIAKIEILSEERKKIDPSCFDDLAEELLEGPYHLIDILPLQVPADSEGQYFKINRYFLSKENIVGLKKRFIGLLVKMNCYYDMYVSFDSHKTWTCNPDPADFEKELIEMKDNQFMRIIYPTCEAMIDYEPD
ncbi:MAG: hypothetical protein IIU37_06615, partial [Erysipelotrichaceae bacterium]|nr:hypothetical protein [Erysipelotrichaceae bacterium]